MSTKSLMLLALMASCAVVRAEPFDRRQIAADATWLVHLDFDAIRGSQSASLAVGTWLQTEPARSYLAGIQKAVGLNVASDLYSATLYGQQLSPDRGTLVVRASLDKPQVMAFLAQQPGYARRQHGGREVLTWTEHRGGLKYSIFGAMHGNEGMVFSRDADELTTALAVLDGKAGHLAESDSPLQGAVPGGTVLLVHASGLPAAKLALQSPILRQSEAIDLTAGEESGAAFVEIRLTTTSVEHVPQFQEVATGLIALARLMRADDDGVLRLLEAITISADDRTVSVRWSGQLVDLLRVADSERLRIQHN